MAPYVYATHHDIESTPDLNIDTLIGIKTPSGTELDMSETEKVSSTTRNNAKCSEIYWRPHALSPSGQTQFDLI